MTTTAPCTVNDRLGALEACAVQFKDHLIDVPGVVLTSSVRLWVATWARQAPVDKSVLPKNACLRPGARLWKELKALVHESKVYSSNDTISSATRNVILTIVHGLINHQGFLDKDWYDDALEELDKTDLVPDTISGDKRTYLVYSAFAEIVCVAVMSHCVNMTFLIMGKPVPRLPTQSEIDIGEAKRKGPRWLDWSAILKKPPRRDPTVSFAYFFAAADIRQKSPEYLQIAESARKALLTYVDPYHPCVAVCLAAQDIGIMARMEEVYYMAKEITKPGNDGTVANSKRYKLLENLITAAVTRPLVMSDVNQASQELKQEEGEATLVEACALIGAFEEFTKITQGTGRPPLPESMTWIMRTVFGIFRFFYELLYGRNR